MKMKKYTLFFLLSFLATTAAYSQTNGGSVERKDTIRVPLKKVDHDDTYYPKSPVIPPVIDISGNTLFIYSGCDNTTLELYAEDETLVYYTYIPEGTEQITLPDDLTGMFELRIIRGSITFVAEIEL